VTLAVTSVLERLEVEYVVGGSLATSLHGIPRATLDVDIVADLRMAHLSTGSGPDLGSDAGRLLVERSDLPLETATAPTCIRDSFLTQDTWKADGSPNGRLRSSRGG